MKVRTFEITPVRKVNLLPGASPMGALKAKGTLDSENNLINGNHNLRLSPSKKMLSFPNDATPIGNVGRLEII